MGQLQDAGEGLPSLAFPDIRDPLARAKKGATLEIQELRDCAMVLGLLEESGRFVARHQNEAPALASVAHALQSIGELRPVNAALDAAIHSGWLGQGVGDAGTPAPDPSGSVAQAADAASGGSNPPLASL